MLRQLWERAKAKVKWYQRREPEKTDLYRLVSSGRDELPRVWDERFQSEYGCLRDEVLTTFDAYLNCGLLEHGAARVYCDSCRHSYLVAYSCKKRGVCVSCMAKRAVKFAEHLYEHVLEKIPHRHITFTIPKRIRVFLRYDRGLNDILFSAAWGALKKCLAAEGTLAAVLTVQSSGEALNHHPHLHGLLADGSFLSDGTFVPFKEIDLGKLNLSFAGRVLAEFHKRELISEEDVAQILSQEHTGFSVWLGDAFEDKERTLFVARYIERCGLSLQKLSIDEDVVTYITNDGQAHEFDALEFLALLSLGVPKPSESVIRYYGWYSCRGRGERKKRSKLPAASISELPEGPTPTPSLTWAQCIRRIYEVDPLECPRCGAEMRIIAFLHDHHEIEKIMQSLDIPRSQSPPPVPMPESGTGEEVLDWA